MSEENPNQNQDQNSQNNNQESSEISQNFEIPKETPIKRIFNYERVDKSKKYYKNQSPPNNTGNYMDNIFLRDSSSLLDKSKKSTGEDKINIKEIDWKRASELFKENLTLFPSLQKSQNETEEEYHNFKINFRKNKGELFSHYTQFFHAISLLSSIPNLIENIFESKEISENNYYTLYVYANGDYHKVILDDFFPVVKGTSSLRFAKPDKEEIWLPLLEKAFAKTHGGYGSLITCEVSEVIQCFTGVPVEKFNLSDLDDDDIKIVLNNCKENFVFLEPKKNICKEIGIIEGKAYQLKDFYDIGSNEENKNNIVLKVFNMFENNKYKGKWSSEGELFTGEIKTKVGFNSEDKLHIYFSFDYLKKYFSKIIIVYKLFDCNIKQITVKEEALRFPQVFNLYIPSEAKVGFSLIFKFKESLVNLNQKIICPSTICISQYNSEEKKFINFDGTFSSDEDGPQTCRKLKSGFYLIWTYTPPGLHNGGTPLEYDLKISCNEYFKLRIKNCDMKYHLIKNVLYSGIKQYQGDFLKEDEITFMDDNYYNFSGLGFKLIYNPFKDCFQKWIFKSQVKNMVLLYPYSKFEHFEIQVLPSNYFLLIGIKINNDEVGKLDLKSYFKTIKYDENSVSQIKNTENININFDEFCSNDVEKDEKDFKYYKYLNDDGAKIEAEEFREDKIIYDHLYNNYTTYMDKIKELPVLNKTEEKNLKFFEIKNLDGIYVGQVNQENKKCGRGALIKNNGNYFVGYWKNDDKNGKGTEYNKEGEIISEGDYKNGKLIEQKS